MRMASGEDWRCGPARPCASRSTTRARSPWRVDGALSALRGLVRTARVAAERHHGDPKHLRRCGCNFAAPAVWSNGGPAPLEPALGPDVGPGGRIRPEVAAHRTGRGGTAMPDTTVVKVDAAYS